VLLTVRMGCEKIGGDASGEEGKLVPQSSGGGGLFKLQKNMVGKGVNHAKE